MNIKPKTAFVLILLTVGLVISAAAFAGESADTIYHNGTIITINDTQPRAEAVAVRNGKILAVGEKGDDPSPGKADHADAVRVNLLSLGKIGDGVARGRHRVDQIVSVKIGTGIEQVRDIHIRTAGP